MERHAASHVMDADKLSHNRHLMEEHLQRARILREVQRQNIRDKADDLSQERLEWVSVPTRVQIEPNRRCNLACRHCDIEHPWDSTLDLEVIERLFDSIGSRTMEVMPYAGGEPTLGPLGALAPLLRRYNNYFSFTTNGVLCTAELFGQIADVTGRVTFSIHGHTKAIFDAIVPGTDFDLIVKNARECLEIAHHTDTQLLVGIVLMEPNIDHLPEWFHWIADMGFQHAGLTNLYPGTARLGELGIYEHRSKEHVSDIVRAAMEVANERGVFVETNVPEAYYTHFPENKLTRATPFDIFSEVNSICSFFKPGFCPLLANMITIEYDGTVLPCCRAHYAVGNVKEREFLDIWNGEAMQRLRETFFRRRVYSGCMQCQDFFCDNMHPGQPEVADLGRTFEEEFPQRRVRQ